MLGYNDEIAYYFRDEMYFEMTQLICIGKGGCFPMKLSLCGSFTDVVQLLPSQVSYVPWDRAGCGTGRS